MVLCADRVNNSYLKIHVYLFRLAFAKPCEGLMLEHIRNWGSGVPMGMEIGEHKKLTNAYPVYAKHPESKM